MQVITVQPNCWSDEQADVFIDGTKQTAIDTYRGSTLYRMLLYRKTGLGSVSHTIRLVVTGTKSSSSGCTDVSIDAIEYQGGGGGTSTIEPTAVPTIAPIPGPT
jgi:hypothetical protein